MERILSGDEKIRKAEEIYYKRKMGLPMNSGVRQAKEPKSYLASKILLELLLILNLAVVILAVQNKDFVFTEEFLASTENYKSNLSKSVKSLFGIEEEAIDEIEQSTDNEKIENTDTVEELVPNEEEASSISQMEQDVEEIKQSYSFEKPIQGTVTSLFGARESEYQNVTGYHTGVDIGADTGTSITAAIGRNCNISFERG